MSPELRMRICCWIRGLPPEPWLETLAKHPDLAFGLMRTITPFLVFRDWPFLVRRALRKAEIWIYVNLWFFTYDDFDDYK